MRITDKVVLNCGGAASVGRFLTEAWLVEEASEVTSNIRRTALSDLRPVTVVEGYCATKVSQ